MSGFVAGLRARNASRTVFAPSSQIVGSASTSGRKRLSLNFMAVAPMPEMMMSTTRPFLVSALVTVEMSLISPWWISRFVSIVC